MSADDRHEKWVLVEPGTVIPAGQPWRQENHGPGLRRRTIATESVSNTDEPVGPDLPVWVDSSWRPPLELPTTPTWGIAAFRAGQMFVGEWCVHADGRFGTRRSDQWAVTAVLDFIPLTDEQIARIEAAR